MLAGCDGDREDRPHFRRGDCGLEPRLLAQKAAGFETTIVERAPQLTIGGYVVDFWGLGYDIAERMRLAARLESVGYHIREFRVVDGEGRRIAGFGTTAFNALTGGRFITLPRSALSRLLFETISPSCEALFDDEIVSLQEMNDHVRVRFQHAGERDFALVIGADGLHSNVRRLAFRDIQIGPVGMC